MTIQPGQSVYIVILPPALVNMTPGRVIYHRKVLRFDDFAGRYLVYHGIEGVPSWYEALDCFSSFDDAKREAKVRIEARLNELTRLLNGIYAMPEPPLPDD